MTSSRWLHPAIQAAPVKGKRKILFVLSDLYTGGAQRVILSLLRHLDRSRFAPCLLVIDPRGPLFSEVPNDIPVLKAPLPRVRYAIPFIWRTVRRLQPAYLVSTLFHLNLYVLAFKWLLPASCRIVVREANTPSVRLVHTRFPGLIRFLYRRLYPKADLIICNSRDMKEDVTRICRLPRHRVRLLNNPVDLAAISARIRSETSPYPPGRFNLVAVGRLNLQKGFDLLIQAMSAVATRCPEACLTIVGDGPERGRLEKIIDSLHLSSQVRLTGRKDDPYPFMAFADVMVSSSRWEGMPNAVLEALACGTPVVAFDCPGGTREVIEPGGNGWLVADGDVDGLGDRIVEIIRTQAQQRFNSRNLLPHRFRLPTVLSHLERMLS